LQGQQVKIASLAQQVRLLPRCAMQPVNQPSSIAAREIFVSVLPLQSASQVFAIQYRWEHR
jgi:hypothetical protein